LASTISVPSTRTCSGYIAFTAAAVPHGMKAGVRITPCGVTISPMRAAPSYLWTEKVKGVSVMKLVNARDLVARFLLAVLDGEKLADADQSLPYVCRSHPIGRTVGAKIDHPMGIHVEGVDLRAIEVTVQSEDDVLALDHSVISNREVEKIGYSVVLRRAQG
jgi:hypothetical protein